MIVETKLVDRVLDKIKDEDDRKIELMASGNLSDFSSYNKAAGYRKALADCKILLTETLDEIMKE